MHSALVVGVAGGTASGKTTLVAALDESLRNLGLRVRTFSLDAYFHSELENSPQVTLPTGQVWFDRNHPDSADTARLVSDIRNAREENDIVIIEGHMVLALDSVRELMDVKLFVDLDDDTRALRRMLRDMRGGRGNTDPGFIAEYYLTCAKRGHDRYIAPSRIYADMILRGDADLPHTTRLLTTMLHGLAGQD